MIKGKKKLLNNTINGNIIRELINCVEQLNKSFALDVKKTPYEI